MVSMNIILIHSIAPYTPPQRVLGPKGQNLKLISALSNGARIRLRGEGFQGRDFQNPLQLNLSATDLSAFVLSRSMAMRLLRQIYEDWSEYQGAKQVEATGIRLLNHPMNPEDAFDEAAAFRKMPAAMLEAAKDGKFITRTPSAYRCPVAGASFVVAE